MKKENIALSGITRRVDDGISQDGACSELINMRVANGSLEPVGRPILRKGFTSGLEPFYIHKNGTYEHIISLFNGKVVFDSVRQADGTYKNKNIVICTLDVKQMQSIGNMLIMASDNGIHYAIFADGNYKYLGDAPAEPAVHVYYAKDRTDTETDDIWCDIDPRIRLNKGADTSTALNETSKTLVNDSFEGNYHKLVNKIYDEGKMIYPMLVRYAIRLHDGNYIYHSSPLLIGANEHVRMRVLRITEADGNITDFTYKLAVRPGIPYISYDTTYLNAWSDMIASVDVFATKPVVINNLDQKIDEIGGYYGGNVHFDIPRKGEKEIIEELSDASSFYLIRSIPVGNSASGENLFSEGNAFKNMEQNTHLPDDGFSRNRISGRIFCYNGRLHVANITTRLAPFYDMNMFSEGTISGTEISTEVHIKTAGGMKVVHGKGTVGGTFSPYLSYPDPRAVKVVLYTSSGHREFALKPHPFLNIAYSLRQLTPYDINDFREVYSPVAEDSVEVDTNKLKVSEIQNPIFFPVAQTYTVSNRDIITMCAATTALSSGMYSGLPLYVFTKEGIYAMIVGDNVVYSNSMPVTRDCCVSAESVVSTDDSVVFGTETGIKIIRGQSTRDISDSIEGYLPSYVDSSPIIKKIANIAGMGDKLSTTEFVHYIKGCGIGYIYDSAEIIVSNSAYPYSYVHELKSGMWHKTDYSVTRFLNSYPESLAILKDKGMYSLHNPHRTVNDVLALSRPIKLGTTTHKRILQAALRGVIRPSLSDVYFRGEHVKFRGDNVSIFSNAGFYVLGSNDAEHFTLVAGREKIVDVRDLITKMNKSKAYKYFMLALVGGVRTDVALNYIEMIVDETYENRLR